MFKKLRIRIMMFNVLIISLVMLAAFTVIYFVTQDNVERENTQRLQAVSEMFSKPNRPLPEGIPGTTPERFSVEYSISFVLFIKDNKLANVNSRLDLDEDVYIDAFEKTRNLQKGQITLADRQWLFAVDERPPAPGPGTFPGMTEDSGTSRIIFLDITNGSMLLRNLMITLILVGLGVLLILFWVSYRFALRAVGPIEETYNRQKQFIADASHEFRTPLAVISANVDAITASDEASVSSQKEWFDYIRSQLKRSEKLVTDLLFLAKYEDVNYDESQAFDLSVSCETASASMEALLYEGGKLLKTDIAENIMVVADSDRITQVLYILLDNADKYTPKGGEISLTLVREGDKAVLRITNSGSFITSEDLPKIFDRFYRADASRSSESGGTGLGLSIAKTIIEKSKGSITAESNKERTTFTVKLAVQKS